MIDTAAIRCNWAVVHDVQLDPAAAVAAIRGLCDVLDRLTAQRDEARRGMDNWRGTAYSLGGERDALHREIERLRAELREQWAWCAATNNPRSAASQVIRERDELRAELERVTEWWKSEQALRRDVDIRAQAAETKVAAGLALADDMETWCSPHGVAVEYARRVRAVLSGEVET